MKKDSYLAGFKRFANILRIVMNVFYIASITGIILLLLSIPAIQLLTNGNITAKNVLNGNTSLNLFTGSGISFTIPTGSIPQDADLRRVVMSIIGTSIIVLLATMVIFRQMRDILKTVSTGTPFEEKNSQRLLNIGATFIGGSIAFNVFIGFVLSNIVSALKIKNLNVTTGIDMFMLFVGILMIILSGVFKYGAFLQKEYDTTL